VSAVTAPVRHARWPAADHGMPPATSRHARRPAVARHGASVAPVRRTGRQPASPEAREPSLRLVRSSKAASRSRSRHVGLWMVIMFGVFCASVFGVVALNAMTAAEAVEARDIEARIVANERELSRLVAEVAALEEPARIRMLAEESGMIVAPTTRFLPVQRSLAADAGFAAAFDARALTPLPAAAEPGSGSSSLMRE